MLNGGNFMDKFVSGLAIGGNATGLVFGVASVEFFSTFYLILGCISFIIGIIAGTCKLVMIIRKALKDGKITAEEVEEIIDQAEEIKNNIDKEIKK